MKTHEFWREHGDGVWAVELEDGVVVRCRGPLHASEIDETLLADLEYSPDRAAWIDMNRASFDLLEPAQPYG